MLTIGPSVPTQYCIDVNAHALARYAALCQEGGLVPIVEPGCLIDGDHTIDRCYGSRTPRFTQCSISSTYKESPSST